MDSNSIGMFMDVILVFLGVKTIYQSEIVLSKDRKITGWWARGIGIVILLAVAMNYIPVQGQWLKLVSMAILMVIFVAALVYLYWKKKQ